MASTKRGIENTVETKMNAFFYGTFQFQAVEKKRNLFNWKHVRDAFRVVFKKRTYNRRLYILLSMLIFLLIIAPIYGEVSIRYLYVRTRYGWEVTEYSTYTTFDSALSIVGKFLII